MYPVSWQMEEARYRMRELEIEANNYRMYREARRGQPTVSDRCCAWLGDVMIRWGHWLKHEPLTPQAIKH